MLEAKTYDLALLSRLSQAIFCMGVLFWYYCPPFRFYGISTAVKLFYHTSPNILSYIQSRVAYDQDRPEYVNSVKRSWSMLFSGRPFRVAFSGEKGIYGYARGGILWLSLMGRITRTWKWGCMNRASLSWIDSFTSHISKADRAHTFPSRTVERSSTTECFPWVSIAWHGLDDDDHVVHGDDDYDYNDDGVAYYGP